MKARRFPPAVRLGCLSLVLSGLFLCFGGAAVFLVWKSVKLFLAGSWGQSLDFAMAALMFGVTSLGNALSHHFTIFVAWRMLGGVAIGLASGLSPMPDRNLPAPR